MSQSIGTEEKVRSYYNMVYRFALVQVKNRQDAEDITQETFYRFLKKAPVFVCEEQEKAWLFQVAMNLCRNLWRASWYKEILPLHEKLFSDEISPETSVLLNEEEKAVMEAVWKLPYKYREVIQLFYYSQLSIRQISELTGCKESTIQTRLARGRDLLKKSI